MDTLNFQYIFSQILITVLSIGIAGLMIIPVYWMIVERKNVKQKQWRKY